MTDRDLFIYRYVIRSVVAGIFGRIPDEIQVSMTPGVLANMSHILSLKTDRKDAEGKVIYQRPLIV